MDRRSFLKHVARATAVAGAAGAGGWPAPAAEAAAGARDGAGSAPTKPASGGGPAATGGQASAAPAAAVSGASVPAAAAPAERLTLVGAGDCIITRRVREVTHPDFLELAGLVRGADCAWGNCEIVIGKGDELYPALKDEDLHAIGDPWTADELRWMGFRLMGTANNHTVDFGHRGLFSTLEHLDRVGIAHAGSGRDLDEAARPGFADTAAGRVGLVSCASTFPPFFAAGPSHPYGKGRPGINPLKVKGTVVLDDATFKRLAAARKVLGDLWAEDDYKSLGLPEPPPDPRKFDFGELTIAAGDHADYRSEVDAGDVKRIAEAIGIARGSARVVIASIHAHDARRKLALSDPFLETFARGTIDAGADVYFSSGPHVLRGIEMYKGKPIFYSLSNFFFQLETNRYLVAEDLLFGGLDGRGLDPGALERKIGLPRQQRFWQSFLPRITFAGGRVEAVELFPLTLGFGDPPDRLGTPRLARGEEAAAILRQLAALSAPYGTVIDVQDGIGRVRLG